MSHTTLYSTMKCYVFYMHSTMQLTMLPPLFNSLYSLITPTLSTYFTLYVRDIHDSIRGSIWIRTHGFSKSYNLELDPWENPHTDNPSRWLKYLRIYNSTAGHRYSCPVRTYSEFR